MRVLYVFMAVAFSIFPVNASNIDSIKINNTLYKVYTKKNLDYTTEKYTFDAQGKAIDFRSIKKHYVDSLHNHCGNLSIRLKNKISKMDSSLYLKVRVFYNYDKTVTDFLDKSGKADNFIVNNLKRQSNLNRKMYIRNQFSSVQINAEDNPDKGLRNNEVLYLNRAQIESLQSQNWISVIDLVEDGSVKIEEHIASMYASGGTNCGLNIAGFTYHGEQIQVAIVEAKGLSTSLMNTYFWDVPINKKPGVASTGEHGPSLISAIRNSTGQIANFSKGAAYNIQRINYAQLYLDSQNNLLIDSLISTYQWCMDQNSYIINNAWGIWRWESDYDNTTANKLDWYYDYWANENYVLLVGSAGNAGAGTLPWYECVNSNNPLWDSSSCEQCMKYAHNMVIVGSVDRTLNNGFYQKSFFSSWRDGPMGDEVPHVTTIGGGVILPWGQDLSGTSMSTAAISAFAANIVSFNSSLQTYPEMLRVIMMTSTVSNPTFSDGRWSTSTYQDLKGGAGVPDGQLAQKITENMIWGNPRDTLKTIAGCTNFTFASGAVDGDSLVYYLRIDTAACTITSFVTWMSNPDHVPVGSIVPPDDIDIAVFDNTGTEIASGISSKLTTEFVKINHPGGKKTYKIKISIWDRVSTANHQIWGGLAWAKSNY